MASVNGSGSNRSVWGGGSGGGLDWCSEEALRPWQAAAGAIMALCLSLGAPANVGVVVRLGRQLRGASISRRLFFSLAVSDLLSLLCLPVAVLIWYLGPEMPRELCQALFFFFFFCIKSSTNILVLISIQRFLQILHPQRWLRVERRWQRLLLASVWLLAGVLALPALFSLGDDKKRNEYLSCKNQRISPELEVAYIVFLVSSHALLLTFYMLLLWGLRRKMKTNRKQQQSTRLFVRILSVSLLVAFPPMLMRLLYVSAVYRHSEYLLCLSKKLTFIECVYFFNHCLNPFLYFHALRNVKNRGGRTESLLIFPNIIRQ